MCDVKEVRGLIARLSDRHYFRSAPASYVEGFVAAAMFVYPTGELASILQQRFFIPDDSRFNLDRYLQSAAELSVQNHLKRQRTVMNFAIDKQVNQPKNVEAYYEVGHAKVSVEVKCPVEQTISENSLVLKTAGRVPDHMDKYHGLKSAIERPGSTHTLELAKNKDNTMKDFLVLANDKFQPASGVDDLNVLLLACGDVANIQDWTHYLDGGEGLFTSEPFHTPKAYQLVDVVILSNLKYFHTEARQFHDWSLTDAFLLAFRNPHGRSSLVSESIKEGLSVFNHHLIRFAQFTPKPLSADTPTYVMDMVKVIHYVVEHLTESERTRFFPVKPKTSNGPGGTGVTSLVHPQVTDFRVSSAASKVASPK